MKACDPHSASEGRQTHPRSTGGHPLLGRDDRGPGPTLTPDALGRRIGRAALAFRGYEPSNLGRSGELAEHPRYGPIVAEVLEQAGAAIRDLTGLKIDLAEHVRSGRHGEIDRLAEDNASIVAMEIAQLRILEELFAIPAGRARLSFGFSTGELAALCFGGVFSLGQLLGFLVPMAVDCAGLASDARLGVLSTKRSALRPDDVERACRAVRSEGRGLIGPSAYLSPRVALVVGQGDTLGLLAGLLGEYLPPDASLRRKQERWTPLHSPLVWRESIPNRTAVSLHRIEGPLRRPTPTVISCVTGGASYDPMTARELLTRWTDHPQRLWDVLRTVLRSDVELVIHVGPASRLIASTFGAIGSAAGGGRRGSRLSRWGWRILSGLRSVPWPAGLRPEAAALLAAPRLVHVSLEDWLLEQEPVPTEASPTSRP